MRGKNKKKIINSAYITTLNIWISVCMLCAFGCLMVYSASAYSCAVDPDCMNDMFLLKKQVIFVILGVLIMLFGQFRDYRKLLKRSEILYFVGIATILALLTGIAISSNGATRWLDLKVVTVQPAEVVKVTTIIMLAYMISNYQKHLSRPKMTLCLWAIGVLPAGLLFKISNDLSSSLVVLGITFLCSFIACDTIKLHAAVFSFAVVGAGAYKYYISQNMPSEAELQEKSFRVGRIAAWIDPERYANGLGYQTLQSEYAIGRGGVMGKGIGQSIQKLSAIPEAQNDMIFAIICEELGIVGAATIVFLIAYLLFQLYKIAVNSKTLFGSIIVIGVMAHIALQTIINIAVATGFFPNTGLALPFISYGGSSIVCLLLEITLCLEVNRKIYAR